MTLSLEIFCFLFLSTNSLNRPPLTRSSPLFAFSWQKDHYIMCWCYLFAFSFFVLRSSFFVLRSSFFFFLPISFKTKITLQRFCVTNQLPHLLPHFAGNFSFVFIQIEKGAPKKTQDFWTFDSTDFAKVIQISSLFLCFSSIYFPLAFLIGK